MSDSSNGTTNQPQIDSRANLFYLLQTLAEHAQARTHARKTCEESSITNEQIEKYLNQNLPI